MPIPSAPGAPERPLLVTGGFLRLWLSGALISTVRWLELLVIAVYVYEHTGSPFVVSMMTVLRMLPLALFGAWAGALAERVDRKRMLVVGLVLMVVVNGTLAALAIAGTLRIWHLGAGAFLGGMLWITDFPVRRTLLGEVAGNARVGRAMSLDTITNNGTRMLGPVLGGLLLQVLGLDGAFVLGALAHALALLLIVGFRRPAEPAPLFAPPAVLASIRDGLRLAVRDRHIAGILAVTLVFNIWAFPCLSMVPVLGVERLGLDALHIGLLASAEGAGAFAGAIAVAMFSRMRHYRRLYFHGVVANLLLLLVFAHTGLAGPAGVVLLASGVAAACFSSMQSTLVFLCAPPQARGRMMGVLSVCVGSGPLGFLHLGLLADLLGARGAVSLVAVEGLVALALCARYFPEVRADQEASN